MYLTFSGSLDELVENLVKTWEFEASHKSSMDQWTTIEHPNYEVQINEGPCMDGSHVMQMGNYNAIMRECPAYKKCEYP